MRFSKIAVIIMFASIGVFVITMTAIYCIKGSIPDTLIQEFFGFFKIEGGALALITIGKEAFDAVAKRRRKDERENYNSDSGDNDNPCFDTSSTDEV